MPTELNNIPLRKHRGASVPLENIDPSGEDFRLVFERSQIGMLVTDPLGNLLRANPALLKMLDYASEEEFRGLNVVDFSHPEDRERTVGLLQEIREGRRDSYQIEKRYLRRDGECVWVAVSIAIVRGTPWAATHYVATVEDLTLSRAAHEAQKAAEQFKAQLIQSQKLEAVAHLAGSVAHDFNNILTAMGLHLEMMAEPGTTVDAVQAGLATLKHAVSRASGLTRQLLLFSRREAVTREKTDIQTLTANVTRLLEHLLGENIKLINQVSKTPCEAVVDPGMIEQVLANLIINARDAVGAAGTITVEVRPVHISKEGVSTVSRHPAARPGAFIAIVVTDDGVGMTPDILSRIFDPFFTTKKQGHGTGLGLSTVQGIVEQHDGWIDVVSASGLGTTFTVCIPVGYEIARSEPPGRPGRPNGGTESILLVEDETTVRTVAALTLGRWGYTVHLADDGDKAIAMMTGNAAPAIDLLLSDISMPGSTDGRRLARWFGDHQPRVPVVLMSGYEYTAAPKEREYYYLKKPFESKVLLATVRQALDARAGDFRTG